MLKYSLEENQLITRRNNFLARPHAKESYDKMKFIKRLVGKGTLVTETDAVAALNAIENTVMEILEEGSMINLPLFNTSFSISGVFDSPDDIFDTNRHKLNVNLTKGSLLRGVEKRISVEKSYKASPHPQIVEVKDIFSGEKNSVLTSNGAIVVRGYNIKIEGDDPACGLWFAGNDKEIKAEILSENKPSMLLAVIPVLDKGEYQLKVATQYSRSRTLKTIKEYIYPISLQVL